MPHSKRVKRFDLSTARAEIEKLLRPSVEETPDELVFVVATDVSPKTR